MDLYEHQARALFQEYGIVVPRAEVTDSPKEAREIARRLGGRVVVKAQVKTAAVARRVVSGSPPTRPTPSSPRAGSSAWTSRGTRSAR